MSAVLMRRSVRLSTSSSVRRTATKKNVGVCRALSTSSTTWRSNQSVTRMAPKMGDSMRHNNVMLQKRTFLNRAWFHFSKDPLEELNIDISVEEVEELRNKDDNGMLIVDVRNGIELSEDGALKAGKAEYQHVPMDYILACKNKEELQAAIKPKRSLGSYKTVAFMCRRGQRSHSCAVHVSELECFENDTPAIANIQGGMMRYEKLFPDAILE